MSLLIINTVKECNIQTQKVISKLTENIKFYKIINTHDLTISHCTGCGICMLLTPGKCCINDDFEGILKSCLVYDDIIFISDSTLNFVSIDTVKIIQRLFPLVTIFSFYDNGKIRHIPRYKKTNNCFLLYQGELNKTLLKDWFNLCTNHLGFTAKGVFSIHDEEIYRCILQ